LGFRVAAVKVYRTVTPKPQTPTPITITITITITIITITITLAQYHMPPLLPALGILLSKPMKPVLQRVGLGFRV
jgi:hypothetical protein